MAIAAFGAASALPAAPKAKAKAKARAAPRSSRRPRFSGVMKGWMNFAIGKGGLVSWHVLHPSAPLFAKDVALVTKEVLEQTMDSASEEIIRTVKDRLRQKGWRCSELVCNNPGSVEPKTVMFERSGSKFMKRWTMHRRGYHVLFGT